MRWRLCANFSREVAFSSKHQCVVKDKPMLTIWRPEDWKKPNFFGKVANIVAKTKNGKISTLLLVQNIYMIPLLKPLNDINISCLVTAHSGENAKNCFHKNNISPILGPFTQRQIRPGLQKIAENAKCCSILSHYFNQTHFSKN